ncbi:YwqG family protein [Streptomyces sp. LN785]|uniref:YwqG family protein n=1 Tax=Streptomyces sp. LN785 TaxID=3112983 RepID=UPI003715E95D
MTQGPSGTLRELAHEHLPSDIAEQWLGLLRPGFRLEPATGADEPAGRLGGLPELPADVEWPSWEGHGPLSFIASVDCAALPAGVLDIPLPEDGTLSFFYFDGRLDDGDALVLPEERDSWAGARVIHVPGGSACATRKAPAELPPYPQVWLTARATGTATDPWHPDVREAFAPEAPFGRYDHPVCAQEFLDALGDHDGVAGHRIGGHARSIQNPVEIEIAAAVRDEPLSWNDPELSREAREWLLLAQFDSDTAADMMWGDSGVLYWLIRRQDLADLRFDRAMFTWQCS